MEDYHLQPTLAISTDIPATWLSLLGLDPPLPPESYLQGKSILIPRKERDWTVDRSVLSNGRGFPEKDKISAIVDKTHKLWFRVDSVDPTTRAMHYRIEKFTDIKDEESPNGCTLALMREKIEMLYQRERTGENESEKKENENEECPAERFWGYLRHFEKDFWKFFEYQP